MVHTFLRDDATFAAIGGGDLPRELLSAARTYYVRTDGSDSNNGLTNTSGGAFLTLQKAYNTIASAVDLGGQAVTVQVADGTYTAAPGLSISQPWTGGGFVTFQGNLSTPANCLIQPSAGACFTVSANLPSPLTFRGFKLVAGVGQGIAHLGLGQIQFDTLDFGTTSGPQILVAEPGGLVQAMNSYTISGGAPAHCRLFLPCVFQAINVMTITVTGTPTFVTFADCTNGGTVYFGAGQVKFSGSAHGQKYSAVTHSLINTNGGGINYFPGDVAGTVDGTSSYA